MSWLESGNFPCCFIGCTREADYIIGTNYHDYTHLCIEHRDEFEHPQNSIVKPIIRKVIVNLFDGTGGKEEETFMNNRDKSCEDCKYCRCNGDWCNERETLPEDIGTKFIKDGLEYTKSCPSFEWD